MISTDAQKRLDRIDAIRASMAALDRELEDLLGGSGPLPLTVRDKPNGGKGRPTNQRRCSNCLEVGHQARKCPKTEGGGGAIPKTAAGAMTEEQFKDVKVGKENGLSAKDVAGEMEGMSIHEVNKAFLAHDYKGYLIIRKRA